VGVHRRGIRGGVSGRAAGAESVAMITALVIGIAFGFALERAGLGSARKLTGQFYFTDFTVFKVMFSAIVTAMLGAFWLSRFGLLDLTRVFIPETWLAPQLVGGLLFGIGFVIAGLCPGTSCVAAATGRGDGAMVMLGMFSGVLLTGLAFSPLQRFYESTSRGTLTLPSLMHVPYGVVVCAIVFLALAAFFGLRQRELPLSLDAEGKAATGVAAVHKKLIVVAAILSIGAAVPHATIAVDTIAREVAREEDHVTALELAQWIKERKPGLRVIDLRDDRRETMPSSEAMTVESVVRATFQPHETVVLISDGGAHAAQAWVLLRASGLHHVYFLRGGYAEWNETVLHPAKSTEITRYFRRGGC
jgi:uncharacterized membrane protein YedE/YeeE/rhodanese-related sulfurtransferase